MDSRKRMGKDKDGVIFPVAPNLSEMSDSYLDFIEAIKKEIENQRLKVVLNANSSMICLYWNIGKAILQKQEENPKGILLGAFVENQLVAMASVLPVSDSHERYRHRGGFGISVLQGYWNQGIASLLIPRVLECAHQAGYEQVELEVLTDNEKAISLYQRHGFREYGCRPHDVKMRDGSYRDALLMLRPL